MEKKVNYGNELEFFAAALFKKIIKDSKWEELKWAFLNFLIEDIQIGGSPKWWEQLTDIPLEIYLKSSQDKIYKQRLYIESKAYFAGKDVSEEILSNNVNQFLVKNKQRDWYWDCYIFFKPGNKNINTGGNLYNLLDIYSNYEIFPNHWFEIADGWFQQSDIVRICKEIKIISNGKKYLEDSQNKQIQELCDIFFSHHVDDLLELKKYLLNNLSLSIKKFEESPQRLSIMLNQIADNNLSKDDIDNIMKKELVSSESFILKENQRVFVPKEDSDSINMGLRSYVANKRSAFDVGYVFQYLENYERKIGSSFYLRYLEAKNPIYSLMWDFIDSISAYINTFNEEKEEIIREIIKKDMYSTLWLIVYVWCRGTCNILYRNNNLKIFISSNTMKYD